MIKAILFDFDGTLADTLPFYVKAYDRALQTIGYTYSSNEIPQICFGKSEDVICEKLGVPEKTRKFTESYFSAIKSLFRKAPLFDDTIDTLRSCKTRHIQLGIITFSYRWYIDQMIQQYALGEYFDFIISADDVLHKKPDPEAVLKAVDKLKIKPEEVIVIGDSKSDILMGKSAGATTVLFTQKTYDAFYSLDELRKTEPNYTIDRLHALIDIVNKA